MQSSLSGGYKKPSALHHVEGDIRALSVSLRDAALRQNYVVLG